MRVLIIGGEGFIGRNLTRELSARGDSVEWSEGDILKYVPDGNWDYVVYLAGLPEPSSWPKYPVEVLRLSSDGLTNAVEVALREMCPLLFASSSAVYGKAPVPMSEKSTGYLEIWSPRERYAIGKAYGEALCKAYGEAQGLEYRIVRPFNVYGPEMRRDDTRVISSFIRRGLSGQNLPVAGEGRQYRCFCYIDDFISGILTLMETPSGTVMNIGNPEKHEIREVAQMASEMLGVDIEYVSRDAGDITERIPDIDFALSLGWRPRIDLREGLRRTIEWAREAWK